MHANVENSEKMQILSQRDFSRISHGVREKNEDDLYFYERISCGAAKQLIN